jgi:hypothetical protein
VDLTRFDRKIDSAEYFFLANAGVEISDIEQFRFIDLIVVLNYAAAACPLLASSGSFSLLAARI